MQLQYFIPNYGNYYHFMTESVMGLYRLLSENDQLAEKNCELWYHGRYAPIIQLFSRHPIHDITRRDPIPATVKTLEHIRPEVQEDWVKLRPMAAYVRKMFVYGSTVPGITVIKRINCRIYADHQALVSKLAEFGRPVREAVMEELPLQEQIKIMRNTRILVGPHGSGETNMIFMPDGSKILELYPMGFSDRVFRELAYAFGHELVELESQVPSIIGRKPTPEFAAYLAKHGWPARKDFVAGLPSMEFRRVMRDVASFSIDPAIVIQWLRPMMASFDSPKKSQQPCRRFRARRSISAKT